MSTSASQDTIFYICLSIGSVLLIPTAICFFLMIYRFCIRGDRRQIAGSVRLTCLVSITLSTVCNAFLYSTYLGCKFKYCGGTTMRGTFFFLVVMDSYIIAKIALYIVFINRLYLTFKDSVYQHSKRVFVIYAIIICVIFALLFIFNIMIIVYNAKSTDVEWFISTATVAVYVCSDIMLSSLSLLLFICPIQKLVLLELSDAQFESEMLSSPGPQSAAANSMADTQFNVHIRENKLAHTMTRTIVLSIVAMLSSMSMGAVILLRFVLGWIYVESQHSIVYLDFANIGHMTDNLVSMVCILLNFRFTRFVYLRLCGMCHTGIFGANAVRLRRNVKAGGDAAKECSNELLNTPLMAVDSTT